MDELERLLEVTARWARRCGLSEDDTQRAQTDAWFQWSQRTADYPPTVWARWAVRRVRAGRDLPGCGTGVSDALNHKVDGGGMGRVKDKTPPPDVLASHREEYQLLMGRLTLKHRQVASLRVQGIENQRIALTLGLSPGRISQIAREIAEGWTG